MGFSLPHARGGVSDLLKKELSEIRSSPRPWGCFLMEVVRLSIEVVFPTPVGVFLAMRKLPPELCCLPHARGGVSPMDGGWQERYLSSPRPWGCFPDMLCCRSLPGVFPTPVGVFPPINPRSICWLCLPHARGGVSTPSCRLASDCMSSPRPWGCFSFIIYHSDIERVFPTPVGVFLSRR